MLSKSSSLACPCGAAALRYEHCCGRFLDGGQMPPTALELMRSRYTAYTLCRDDYLRMTWHPSTRPRDERIAEMGVKWLGLDIKSHGEAGDEASVEFVARYRIQGRAHRLHEISRFVREDGSWLYLDGRFPEKA